MDRDTELHGEREYLARVQQLLFAVIGRSKAHAGFQDETIRMMLADAWDELRMKPTALSPQDLEQLNTEIDRFLARKAFSENRAAQYQQMLLHPFFARVDFREVGDQLLEKIVIGLYSLKDESGALVVHDWRAPVCSLYYDALPGSATYTSPSGEISGEMTLKRQYAMEAGRLKYYVDTEYSIDDGMLLDILSGATNTHMRQIVATIQIEQNAAIRHEQSRILSVVGGAGSGKTSVAMHRAAYLMYRHRDVLDAGVIAVMSPSSSFSEYISTVLPDLGEENVRAFTLHAIVSGMIGGAVESPTAQNEVLLKPDSQFRRRSAHYKAGQRMMDLLDAYAARFRTQGPKFDDVSLKRLPLVTRRELERLYREQFKTLTPAQRLTRIHAMLESRLVEWEKSLYPQYEDQFIKSYHGKELDFVTRMAISQQLHPIRMKLKRMLVVKPLVLYAAALRDAPRDLAEAATENAVASRVWWEDAPGVAYLMLMLGFARPNVAIRHLLIDEAQDYADISLRFMRLHFPKAHMTLLGDPNQRTLPGLPECRPEHWGALMGEADGPLLRLSRGYRCTVEINDFCNSFLPESERPISFGRSGEPPMRMDYSPEALTSCIDRWRQQGYRRIAVITRSQAEAAALSPNVKGAHLLDDDDLGEEDGITLSCYHLLKGLEFDAVAVVWPEVEQNDSERRRLYAACSRALHGLNLFVMEDGHAV